MVRRLILGVALPVLFLLTVTLLPAALIAPSPPQWAPSFLQNWAFDIRLALASPGKKVSSIVSGSLWDNRIYIDRAGERVSFQNADITLVGTLYKPPGESKRPGILLLHGSTPEGRRLGLYRILGKELTERGYVVLSKDQRGFGESDDPPSIDRPEDFDTSADIATAIGYLSSLKETDAENLYIVGHSMGANTAITVGIQDERIRKIVAIGPGRRVYERLEAEEDYFRRRTMRYMQLPRPIPAEVHERVQAQALFIDDHLDYFAQPDHKPLLLLDGALESKLDRQFLKDVCDAIAGPKECITLSDADHYANVANFGPLVIFDRRAVEELVQEIDVWLSTDEK